MVYRCILPDWAHKNDPSLPKVREGEFTIEQLKEYNSLNYNIYFFPNSPKLYDGSNVDSSQIDQFNFCMVDMDLKDKIYPSKEAFLDVLENPVPSLIVDSGNGIHAYWDVVDLDAKSYLKLTRRLMRRFKTDSAVGTLAQLMRAPGFNNTKSPDDIKLCEVVKVNDVQYTCEALDALLSPLSVEDTRFCEQHYDKVHNSEKFDTSVKDELPPKFGQLLKSNDEIKKLFCGEHEDRSGADYRLGHLLFAHGFTRDEAASVLINTAKAITRAPIHRNNYAINIVDKIWTFELGGDKGLALSKSVKDILIQGVDKLKGDRFACHKYFDATYHGLRLSQVIGLVAGSGVGKTAVALNMFHGFVENNPNYIHFFVPLEQPANEIALRWKSLCGDRTDLHEKVHIMSNYNDDGSFRHLSLAEIKDYLLKFQEVTKQKVGCVVIDHIAALKKSSKQGENQGVIDICHEMKAFAIQTNTLLVMQSQSSRQKAGIGDLELDKDAAYGTVYFESYCDYLITIWQPLKRCYEEGAPTVTAFKFCKIRHKKAGFDTIQEDVRYTLMFDPQNEGMRELTQTEQKSFEFFNSVATNKRKKDKRTDVVEYKSVNWTQKETD